MSDIKLVLTDMDGTVVVPMRHEVSDKVRQAVIAVEDAGIAVVPVTGRPYEMAKPVMEILGFDSYCVVDNGATIRKAITGELVWSQWLPLETVRQIVEIILPFSTLIDYAEKWDEHVPDAETEMNLVVGPAPYVFSFLPIKELPQVEEALQKIDGIAYHMDIHTGDSAMGGIQVTDKRATKFHGVEALRVLVSVPKQHTLAIGDGGNDLPLFENAGVKVAMGNGTDLLKAEADHVVDTVQNDGFAEAMDRFVLGRSNSRA
jgi:HAD superfamily hydrolase (TIGR01484 family)